MATTTTIYATDDTNLRENAPTTNYGSNALIRVGQYSSYRRHAVFKFDVSSFTEPTDIIKADFTVTTSATSGSSTRTMKYARLNQDFVESEATWNISATGISWSGGAGAEGNGEFTQPTYDITVGDVTGAQTVDIMDLVVDAINRRDDILWLVMCFDPSDSATGTGSSIIHSSEAVTASDRPKIAVTVAERVAWTGARGDGDLDVGANWDTSSEPTADDYALFPSGSEDVVRGDLQCKKVYIGKNYKGSIGTTAAPITFEANELHCNSPYSACHIAINASISTVAEVWISDTARTLGSFRLNGKYTANVKRTRHDIALLTTNVALIDAHTRRSTFTCSDEVTTVRMSGAYATLDDGAGDLTVSNRGYARVSMVDNDGTNITMAGNSSVRCYAEDLDTIVIYSGVARFMGNEGAPIGVGGLEVYPEGLADTRTGAATFTMTSAALMYGGRMLLDGSMATAIA